jgi:GNAT superfamily N-acetyltransferase
MREAPGVVIREAVPSDHDWIVRRHGELYQREYGWDATFQALVATVLEEYANRGDPEREAGWIAEIDGQRVGCIFCMKRTDEVAQLRILLVEPDARGLGVGSRLVDQCIEFARRTGYKQMMLWTNDVLTDARRIYERKGFRLVEEEKHHSFGHDLVGQNWWRDL